MTESMPNFKFSGAGTTLVSRKICTSSEGMPSRMAECQNRCRPTTYLDREEDSEERGEILEKGEEGGEIGT